MSLIYKVKKNGGKLNLFTLTIQSEVAAKTDASSSGHHFLYAGGAISENRNFFRTIRLCTIFLQSNSLYMVVLTSKVGAG